MCPNKGAYLTLSDTLNDSHIQSVLCNKCNYYNLISHVSVGGVTKKKLEKTEKMFYEKKFQIMNTRKALGEHKPLLSSYFPHIL